MRQDKTRPTANQQLRHARELRGWSQQRLAEAVGTNKVMVSRWEGGVMMPSPHFRAQLCDLFGQTAADLGFIPPSSAPEHHTAETLNRRLWHVPAQRNPYFTGREAILAHVQGALHAQGRAPVTQALCGLGGVGKTQTALEYAYRFRDHYQAVLWVRADSRDLLLADLAALAPLLGVEPQDVADQNQAVQAVKRWLQENSGWLLILDNVEDLALVEQALPTPHPGQVLLTIRSPITGTSAQPIVLESMDPAEGALSLLRRAKFLAPDAPLDEAAESLQTPALTLTTLLGGLPLALDQAGAYLEETGCSLDNYLALYRIQRACLLDRRGTAASDHPASVRTTFALALEQVELASPAAADLLRVCTMLHPEAIPEELFSAGAAEMGPLLGTVAADPLALDEALVTLRRFALLYRDLLTRTFSLHRLVQTVLLDSMDEATHHQCAERAVRVVNRVFPNEQQLEGWSLRQRTMPHALTCVELIDHWQMAFPEARQLLTTTGAHLLNCGQYAAALTLQERALTLRRQTMGAGHPEVAASLSELADIHHAQGKEAEAMALYHQALTIFEKALGPEHPEVAQCLQNLATISHYAGQYEQVHPLFERALEIWSKAFGSQHRQVAECLNDWARLAHLQGNPLQAERCYQQALAIYQQLPGPAIPDTAVVLSNLANLYTDQGRCDQAESLFRRALAIYQQAVGFKHPYVAKCLQNFARLQSMQGNDALAESLHRKALSIREQQLGPVHFEVAESLHYLAWLAHEQGQYTQAEPLYQRTLAICMETLGASHPRTLQTRHHLARLVIDCGQEEQAKALCQEVLWLREQTLGADHPEVAESLDLLARVARKQGRPAEAESLAQRAQAIRERALGVTSLS